MIIFNILSFLILITLTNSFFNARYSKNKTLTFSILVVILLIFITYNLNYFFILILYILSIFILYKGQCIQKLIMIIPYYIIQILLEILITYCFTLYHSTVTTLVIIEIILSAGIIFTCVQPILDGDFETAFWTIAGPVFFGLVAFIFYQVSSKKHKMK